MASYRIELSRQVQDFLEALDDKSRRICTNNLRKVAAGPYPGRGSGDKERLPVRGEEIYRMHIGRRYTAFYIILEADRLVRVLELLPIGQAHKKYGYT